MLLGAMIGLLLLVGCSGSTGETSAAATATETVTETVTERPTQEESAQPSSQPSASASADPLEADRPEGEASPEPSVGLALGTREEPLPLGKPALVGNWMLGVNDAVKDATEAVLQENPYAEPPVEGSQYVVVQVLGVYSGNESSDILSDIGFSYVGAAGNTFDSFRCGPAEDSLYDQGEAFPGADVAGVLCFEVPSDQVAGGAVIADAYFGDARAFFGIEGDGAASGESA